MKQFFQNNGGLLLIIALLLTAIIMVSTSVLGGIANPFSNLLGIVSAPIHSGAASVADWIDGIYQYSFSYEMLQEENAALKQQIAELEEQARQGEADSRENRRLRTLLDLRKQRRDFVFESATVLSRASTNWSSTLTLSKGSVHGVSPRDTVIDETGALVGLVDQVGATWCTLLSVVDAGIELGGLAGRTDSAAILEGDFSLMRQGRLKLTYLPETTLLLAGDQILTSGRGGVYPAGLVVGTIESIHTDPSGMGQYAVVAPAVSLNRLSQVFVIKDFTVVE